MSAQCRLLHVASAVVGGQRLRIEVIRFENEPKGSPSRFRVSYRGFPRIKRGRFFEIQAEAERLYLDEVDAYGLEVRW